MPIRFENPAWLFLLIVLVPCAVLALRWFVTMTRIRRATAIGARAMLLAAIVSLLAGAVSVQRTSRLAVVAVVDVSDSVRMFAEGASGDAPAANVIDTVRARLAAAGEDRGPEDLLGVVVFDGRTLAVATPSRADISSRPIDIRMEPGTDIAAALRYAAALIPADAAGRLLLVSDGNQTAGDALEAGEALAARLASGAGDRSRLPIDVVPLTYAVRDEVIVERVDVPPTAAAQSVIPVRVHLLASDVAEGALRLTREGEPLVIGAGGTTSRRLRLSPGRQVEVIEVDLGEGRVHELEAVWEPRRLGEPGDSPSFAGDTRLENNRASGITITPGQGEVLIVDGAGRGSDTGGTATLARTLRAAGLSVSSVSPDGMPRDLIDLQSYDLVVLQDVSADQIDVRTQAALAAHVEELGGGLVMLGGRSSFAPGGWRGSPIEPLLPVDLEVPDDLVIPTAAVMLVLDNSGSMGFGVMGSLRSKQEIANESAALAVSTLDERDLVGVLTFNNQTRTVIPLSPNDDTSRSARQIRSISANGGTRMGPALEEAERQLAAADAEIKHMVVLSDGQSQDAEILPGMAERMADLGIRITSISVGEAADISTMAEIAERGGGEHYVVVNPDVLPRIFVKAVRIVRTPMVREVPFVPTMVPTGSPLVEGLAGMPALGGLVMTQARLDPTISTPLITEEGEPVFAHWQVGLGNVAAFTSDARADAWASRWIDWPGYETFWVRLARTLSRATTPGPYSLRLTERDQSLVLRLDASNDDGSPLDYLSVPATVYDENGEAIELRLAQVGPGAYEGEVPLTGVGRLVTVVRPSLGQNALPPVVGGTTIESDAEYRSLRSNEALLRELAETTGGRVRSLETLGDDLFDRAEIPPRVTSVPIFTPLMLASLALMLLDVGTRRVAWDRFVSREFGADLRRSAAEATRSRTEQARRALSDLKSGRSTAEAEPTHPSGLGDDAASRIVAQARDRRAQAEEERLRKIREEMFGTQPAASEEKRESTKDAPPVIEAGTGGLLAAKRRARERFESEQEETE